jgi:hypothetical protein
MKKQSNFVFGLMVLLFICSVTVVFAGGTKEEAVTEESLKVVLYMNGNLL